MTNTGNVTLHAIALTDSRLGAVACPDTTLAAGQSTTCTAEHVTTQADVDAGHIANTADVTARPPTGSPVTGTDRDTVHAIRTPAIQVGKSSSPDTFGAAGETITYRYAVTNTGNVTLRRITLTDSRLGPVACPDPALAPTASMTCTASYSTTQADVDKGDIENAAVVTGTRRRARRSPTPSPSPSPRSTCRGSTWSSPRSRPSTVPSESRSPTATR